MTRPARHLLLSLLLACAGSGVAIAQQVAPATVTPTQATAEAAPQSPLDALIDADYPGKREIIGQLAGQQQPEVQRALRAMLDGTLYFRIADRRLVTAAAQGDPMALQDVLTGDSLGNAPADTVSAIGTNNQLRRQLRTVIAGFDLADPARATRLAAVQRLMQSIDDETLAVLRDRLPLEPDERVRRQIEVAIAMGELGSGDAAQRLAAVEQLKGSLNSDVFNRFTAMTAVGEDGTPAEADPAVLEAATAALQSIGQWRRFYGFVETLFFGLSLGSVLVLAAIGLAITFGVMGVINMAHGELMMLGAYCVYVVQQALPQAIGSSVLLAIPLAFLVSGLVGVLIERSVVRFLYGRPLETLLATFGVSLILQQLVRDIFSPNNRPVETPGWMAGSLQINEVLSITYTRLYIIVFSFALFLLLLLILKRTRLGLQIRAVAQNRAMARAMGIRSEWVDAMAFGLGSGIAGIAGVALSQLTNVGPNLGQSYIVDSFMVVVFGGVGNLWGTQIGGLTLGVTNKLLEPWVGAVLAKIFVLVGLILFIQRRPRGLFPQRGRAAES